MGVDKRRFPRINLGDLASDLKVINEAKLTRLGGQSVSLDIFDISYDSVAFRSSDGEVKLSQEIEVEIHLAGYESETFKGVVVRLQGDLVAMRLEGVTAEQHLTLEGFLKDKMIGVNTHLVAKEFYSKNENFSHWFHGPNTTNVIIWRSGSGVSKAILEMNTDVLVFNSVFDSSSNSSSGEGQWELNESSRRSQDLPSDDYQVSLKESVELQVPRLVFERAMNILGQMLVTVPPHQRTVLQFLLGDLKTQLSSAKQDS